MNTRELAVAFVLFSRIIIKWAPLGFLRFIFDEGKWYAEIKKKEKFRNGRRHVCVNRSKPFHKLNVSILFPAFFNSAMQV
jgi:hypothetical protein